METSTAPISAGSLLALEALSRIERKPVERLLDEAIADLMNKYREARDPEEAKGTLR
jgi:hypothetical protein